jgi:hypothetical protein
VFTFFHRGVFAVGSSVLSHLCYYFCGTLNSKHGTYEGHSINLFVFTFWYFVFDSHLVLMILSTISGKDRGVVEVKIWNSNLILWQSLPGKTVEYVFFSRSCPVYQFVQSTILSICSKPLFEIISSQLIVWENLILSQSVWENLIPSQTVRENLIISQSEWDFLKQWLALYKIYHSNFEKISKCMRKSHSVSKWMRKTHSVSKCLRFSQ